jgi:hypothetical protein
MPAFRITILQTGLTAIGPVFPFPKARAAFALCPVLARKQPSEAQRRNVAFVPIPVSRQREIYVRLMRS